MNEIAAHRFVLSVVLLVVLSVVLGCQLNSLLDDYLRRLRRWVARRKGEANYRDIA
jgi:hypothetical protein